MFRRVEKIRRLKDFVINNLREGMDKTEVRRVRGYILASLGEL